MASGLTQSKRDNRLLQAMSVSPPQDDEKSAHPEIRGHQEHLRRVASVCGPRNDLREKDGDLVSRLTTELLLSLRKIDAEVKMRAALEARCGELQIENHTLQCQLEALKLERARHPGCAHLLDSQSQRRDLIILERSKDIYKLLLKFRSGRDFIITQTAEKERPRQNPPWYPGGSTGSAEYRRQAKSPSPSSSPRSPSPLPRKSPRSLRK